MNPQVYYVIHVLSVILLAGSVFYIAANPQKHRKKRMMTITGILSLLVLVGAAGLLGKLYKGYDAGGWTQGWVIGKIVLWLFISALAGMAYKKQKNFILAGLTVAVSLAVYLVYFRPF